MQTFLIRDFISKALGLQAPLPGELQQLPPQQTMQQPDLQQHGYLPQFDQLAQAAGGAPPPSHPGVFGF